jgi:cytosine/adenosine deaminase-related metal-dependent hydrolase
MALAGRVVTMDPNDSVIEEGVVYVDAGVILGVRDRRAPRPAGFEKTPIVDTRGTLFPGLIELHNHLCYNALPLWAPIPQPFEYTDQWRGHPDYQRLVNGPMMVIGRTPSLLPSLVRYVEAKCLLSGVTTSQGIRLYSNGGVSTYYRGVVRNVEQTRDPALPEANARIPDVTASDALEFLAELEAAKRTPRCQLLHLSEGVTHANDKTQSARRHFLALRVAPDLWAINEALAGIHASGLLPEDLRLFHGLGGSIVWSPLSNLLLYGATTDIRTARELGVKIGLGSDWSPTGSKNLLCELKVAWLYSQHFLDGLLSPRDLVAMVTRTAAQILRWDAELGSLEPGKRADVLVIAGASGDSHEALVRATELSVRLVVINGFARYGTANLMRRLAPSQEPLRLKSQSYGLYLEQPTTHPAVAPISLAAARDTLRDGLARIRDLARDLERREQAPALERTATERSAGVVWSLALDELHPTGLEIRPRLPYAGPNDFTGPSLAFRGPTADLEAAAPLSEILGPIDLDPLTVVEDPDYLTQLAAQPNVPPAIRDKLSEFYPKAR